MKINVRTVRANSRITNASDILEPRNTKSDHTNIMIDVTMDRLSLCVCILTCLVQTVDCNMADSTNQQAKPVTSSVSKYWLYIGGGMLAGILSLQRNYSTLFLIGLKELVYFVDELTALCI